MHRTAHPHQRSDRLGPGLKPLRRRWPVLCLVLGLFLAGLSAVLVETLVRQAGEIVPDIGYQLWIEPWRSVAETLAQDGGIRATTIAFQTLAARPKDQFDMRPYRQLDPDNGLYDYLALCPQLCAGDTQDEPLRLQISRLRTADPARLYLARRHRAAESVFLESGCPRRVSARGGGRVSCFLKHLREAYPDVIRGFSAAMLGRGRAWREEGRLDAAVSAHVAVVRLLTELVAESPCPNTAILASQILPAAWAELAQDFKASSAAPPENLVTAIEGQASRSAAIRPAWHEAADDRTNVLPFTGLCYHVQLAVSEHQRVMATITSSLLCLVAWLVLLVFCVFWLVLAAVASNPRAVEVRWRTPRISPWLAPVIVCGPCLGLMILLLATSPNYTWFFSFPSIRAVAFWPILILVLVGLAIRFCTTNSDQKLDMSLRRNLTVIAVLITVPLVGALSSLPFRGVGSPPPIVSAFRWAGIALGLVSLFVLVSWILSVLIRARRGGFCVFSWARACLNVTAASFLLMTVITAGALWLNRQADRRHQDAFVRAAADPMSDRLGADWLDRAFTGAGPLIEQIDAWFHAHNVAKPPSR